MTQEPEGQQTVNLRENPYLEAEWPMKKHLRDFVGFISLFRFSTNQQPEHQLSMLFYPERQRLTQVDIGEHSTGAEGRMQSCCPAGKASSTWCKEA